MELVKYDKYNLDLDSKSVFIPIEENIETIEVYNKNINCSDIFKFQTEKIKEEIEYLTKEKKVIAKRLKTLKLQYSERREIYFKLLLIE